MREFVNVFVSGYRVDDGENDVVMLCAVGPRGGTRSVEVLTIDQARAARDQLDLALTRFADRRAREEEPANLRPPSIDHMPDNNSDAVDEDGCPTW